MAARRSLLKSPPAVALIVWLGFALLVNLFEFPYQTDPPQRIDFHPDAPEQRFYDQAYLERERQKEEQYTAVARRAARIYGIEEMVGGFVRNYGLEHAHVLEVGAGSGLLQDQVEDYTALDISATARRYFHKPFVQADARAMPFDDGKFDAVWTIWVLEHVPNPEQALSEMRRVLKPGGMLLLFPAWMASQYAASGYHARSYRDFGPAGKAVKASLYIQDSPLFKALFMLPARAIRRMSWKVTNQPTAFHYRRLTPNYEQYWEPDSDAVNSMDMYEAYLWFKSRGDLCMNCSGEAEMFRTLEMPLVIKVKPELHAGDGN
jgi:SAM-dependent methyltransferase